MLEIGPLILLLRAYTQWYRAGTLTLQEGDAKLSSIMIIYLLSLQFGYMSAVMGLTHRNLFAVSHQSLH